MTAEQFLAGLRETVEWCAPRVDMSCPDTCLRAAALRPLALDPVEGDFLTPEMIAYLVRARRTRLQGAAPSRSPQTNGRLLISAFEYTNFNGGTAHESHGYFDHYDNPPWDTWVCLLQCEPAGTSTTDYGLAWPPNTRSIVSGEAPHQSVLVSWVPAEFEALVDNAIGVECVGMLAWSDELLDASEIAPQFREILPNWLRQLNL